MRTNQNGFAAVWVVLIVAVLLAGAGTYFYTTQTAKPVVVQPVTQTAANGNADLRIYRNAEWGVEIGLPSGWAYNSNESSDTSIVYSAKAVDDNSAAKGVVLTLMSAESIDLLVEKSKNNIVGFGNVIDKAEKIVISGQPAVIMESHYAGPSVAKQPESSVGYYISLPKSIAVKSKEYNFIYVGLTQEDKSIISTFKFIDVQAVVTKTDTASWKNYQNEKCGYEIKYPQNYQAKDIAENAENAPYVVFNSATGGSSFIYCYLAADFLKGVSSLQEYIQEVEDHSISAKPINVGNLTGTEVEGFGAAGSYKDIYLQKGDYILQFNIEKESNEAGIKIFDQMLSTFKFIEPQAVVTKTEIANWQTYRSGLYEIKYPNDYQISGEKLNSAEVNFSKKGAGSEAVSFIARGEDTLAFQGAWGVVPASGADQQKKISSENISFNGANFEKQYWAIRGSGDSEWLTAIVYYVCNSQKTCFSLMQGITVKGIASPMKDGRNIYGKDLTGQDQTQALLDGIKNSKEKDATIFNQMVSTFKFVEPQAVVTKTEILARAGKVLEGQAEKVQLADKTTCFFMGGATGANAENERMNYNCGNAKLSLVIYGDLTEGNVWKANVSNVEYDAAKKVWNVISTKTVDIAKIWR
jgi:hypothetical protein